jgi:ATP-dependent DNA helicase RecG
LVRIQNVYRYDDRECIQTNLIDTYDLLMAFIAKHLPDKFYMEGDQRVSLRTKVFREIVANMIHREYMNALPCTFTIFNNHIEVINANNPHGAGPIDSKNFAPFTKNPTIAKFFIQLGKFDELGSGVLNVNRLISEYNKSGKVEFIEGAAFKTIIPIDNLENEEDNDGTTDGTNEGTIEGTNQLLLSTTSSAVKTKLIELLNKILEQQGKKTNDYKKLLNVSTISNERYLKLLKEANLIEFRGDSLQNGGYFLTHKINKSVSFSTDNEAINKIVNVDFGKQSDREKSRLGKILNYIKSNNDTKILDLANHLKVSARTIKNDIKILTEKELIIYVGSKKAGSYLANFD